MTAPALVWRPYDPSRAPATCGYGGCVCTPVLMRGPRTSLMRLPWRAYCASHASLYGAVPRRRALAVPAGTAAARPTPGTSGPAQ